LPELSKHRSWSVGGIRWFGHDEGRDLQSF
jgi:hypothetical protein